MQAYPGIANGAGPFSRVSAALHAGFQARMLEQGWSLDSGADGAASAVSLWSRTAPGPDIPALEEVSAMSFSLSGTLSVVALDGDGYSIRFRMISRGGQGG